jgi:FHA domain-containing protein/zinc ribbon protein
MITCSRCSTENLDGSKFCDECGMPLESVPRPREQTGLLDAESAKALSMHDGAESMFKTRSAMNPAPEHQAGSVSKPGAATAVAHATLIVERGRSTGKQFPLRETESQIGRWDADGGIFPDVDLDSEDPEAKVSRRHARIVLRGGQYFIEDLGSTNGTFINRGRRLLPGDRQPLRDGDEIIVGKTFLRFRMVS